MGKNSGVDWTNHSWNPWQGCRKVSPGCLNCYMYRDKKRYGQNPATVIRSKPATFNSPLKWKDPAKVFVCSWSDFFIEDADPWRDDAWDIIRKCPQHTFQILTKRPENIKDRLPDDWPLPNVWLGVTAENQEQADKRIPVLLQIPAVVRFMSVEPMISAVDTSSFLGTIHNDLVGANRNEGYGPWVSGIEWVICGGETGPGARPVHPDWVRRLRNQCQDSGVPFFFKQWGEWAPDCLCGRTKACKEINRPNPGNRGCMFRCGKKSSGHLLDGKEYREFPK